MLGLGLVPATGSGKWGGCANGTVVSTVEEPRGAQGEMQRTTGTPVSLQVVQPMVQPCENHMEPPLLARPSLALRESGSIICAPHDVKGLLVPALRRAQRCEEGGGAHHAVPADVNHERGEDGEAEHDACQQKLTLLGAAPLLSTFGDASADAVFSILILFLYYSEGTGP